MLSSGFVSIYFSCAFCLAMLIAVVILVCIASRCPLIDNLGYSSFLLTRSSTTALTRGAASLIVRLSKVRSPVVLYRLKEGIRRRASSFSARLVGVDGRSPCSCLKNIGSCWGVVWKSDGRSSRRSLAPGIGAINDAAIDPVKAPIPSTGARESTTR